MKEIALSSRKSFESLAPRAPSQKRRSPDTLVPLKTHGCTCPLHFLQVTGFVAYFSATLIFYLFQLPTYTDPIRIATLVVYTILTFSVILFGCLTSCSNPTDPELERERAAFARNEQYPLGKDYLYCKFC